jgi:hypothetical protein
MLLKENIVLSENFQTSINIAYDINNFEKIENFIPTKTALIFIEELVKSINSDNEQKARILVGAYGRGKSHIVLFALSILSKKDPNLFQDILKKIKNIDENIYKIIKEYIYSTKKILPVIISGITKDIEQSFLLSLEKTIVENDIENIMPETSFKKAINKIMLWEKKFPDTYENFVQKINFPVDQFVGNLKNYNRETYIKFQEIYPLLTSGSHFSPFEGDDVVEVFEETSKELSKYGYSGIYVIFDEFSKYIETNMGMSNKSDTKFLQDFAEKCDRSKSDAQLHILLISHKEINNYLDSKLAKEKIDAWMGVSGRFKHIVFQNNYDQLYELISEVIVKKKEYIDFLDNNYSNLFDDIKFRMKNLLPFEASNSSLLVKGCYPLHPVSSYILPRISEKVAQNERTLFTFLSSKQKHTLNEFIKNNKDEFSLLTPDIIYDYFEILFKKEPVYSEIYKQFILVNNIIPKVVENSLEEKIIKTIALIYNLNQFEILKPNKELLREIYRYSYSLEQIDKAIENLITEECVLYLKKSNGFLKLKEAFVKDINREILNHQEKIRGKVSSSNILNEFNSYKYLYPNKYNDENDVIRYFRFKFLDSRDFFAVNDWTNFINLEETEGIVYAVIPDSAEDVITIKDRVKQFKKNSDRIVFVILKDYIPIQDVALNYKAIIELKELNSDDFLYSQELDIYIEDFMDILNQFIFSFTKPEKNLSEYYYCGMKKNIKRRAHLSKLLSSIYEDIFINYPIINNEMINKNEITSIALNSRSKIIDGILKSNLEPKLGIHGNGPENSILRSTLINKEILVEEEGNIYLKDISNDEKLNKVLNEIKSFILSASGKEVPLEKLYSLLTGTEKGYGLKKGIIPIYFSVLISKYKKNLVVIFKGKELRITADLLNSINEYPNDYCILLENWDNNKEKYISYLDEAFSKKILLSEKEYNDFDYLASAISRWYMGLPRYSKELDYKIDENENIIKVPNEYKRFNNLLKRVDLNPREFLFIEIPRVFNLDTIDDVLIEKIEKVKSYYENSKIELIYVIEKKIQELFSEGTVSPGEINLVSILKNWLDSMSQKTLQNSFSNNYQRIFTIIANSDFDKFKLIEDLGRAIIGLRIEDWKSDTPKIFFQELRDFKKCIEELDEEASNNIIQDGYSISYIDKNGQEVVKKFSRQEYSNRGKLLYNEITNALEEMGQSITEEEKRQVLMEIIEKMI